MPAWCPRAPSRAVLDAACAPAACSQFPWSYVLQVLLAEREQVTTEAEDAALIAKGRTGPSKHTTESLRARVDEAPTGPALSACFCRALASSRR